MGNERIMRSAHGLALGILLAVAASGLRAQAKQSAQPPAKPAPKAAAPSAKPAGQAATATKPAAKAPAKPVVKVAAPKKPAKPAAKPAREGSGTPAESTEARVVRRDPFESLVSRQRQQGAAAQYLPPGIPGLQVSSLRLDGIVKAPSGMIAVVTNPQSRTYFLREGDQLYDGRVEKITMDSVSFHEVGKDAFGKPVERQVSKRIYSSAGEQQ